ncbi:TIGR02301 family protein, partial [Rhizobium ruizarguesonis]|nr:TIGR02301 family protein [Rhizobium ruizarguesonis]
MLSVSTVSMIPVRRVFLSLLVLAGPTMAQGKNTPPPQEEEIAPPIVSVPYDDKLARFA